MKRRVPEGETVLVCHVQKELYWEAKRVARRRKCKLREVIDSALDEYIAKCAEAKVLGKVLNSEVVSR